MPSRRQQRLREGSLSKGICNTQEDWQAIVLLRVTNTVCINPLAIITSHLIDIPLLCSSLKTFDWLFWKTLPYQHSIGKASFCSSYSQEWPLTIWSPGPLSALSCFAAGLFDSYSAVCSCPQGTWFWGSLCNTHIRNVSCYRKTQGWQAVFTGWALSILQRHPCMGKRKIVTPERTWKNSLQSDCKIKLSHL